MPPTACARVESPAYNPAAGPNACHRSRPEETLWSDSQFRPSGPELNGAVPLILADFSEVGDDCRNCSLFKADSRCSLAWSTAITPISIRWDEPSFWRIRSCAGAPPVSSSFSPAAYSPAAIPLSNRARSTPTTRAWPGSPAVSLACSASFRLAATVMPASCSRATTAWN